MSPDRFASGGYTPRGSQTTPRIALFLPALDGGGAERVFVRLANEFAERGYHVDFVLASARGPYLAEVSARVSIVDLDTGGVLRALPGLRAYLRSRRPAALLAGLTHANVVAIIASRLAAKKTRMVISIRSLPTVWYRHSKSMSSWILLQLMRLTYRLADVVIVNSEAAAEDVVKSLWLSRDRLEVIYNPIDLVRIAKLSREEISHPWLRPDGPPIVLGVGRLDPLKDFATLIRAFAIARLHRACRLVVLGEGEERAALEKLTRELRIQNHVYLPGFVANPFTWMNRAKVFVSSSLTESCPNALLEALACGAQVISTNCEGGCAEILDHGRWGRLTEVGDSDALGQAILAALETEQYPDGCRRVSDFAPERITRQYLEKLLPKGRHQLMGS